MNSRAVPRAAMWLLERLGSTSRLEPLIGDLVEQFEAGRSRIWFWHQATGALAGCVLRAIRANAPSFLAAILVGCALVWVWQLGCSLVFQPVYVDLADVKRHPWTVEALVRLTGILANMASEYALCFISAWLVTRIHREHRRAVLVAFVTALTAQRVPGIVRIVVDGAADSSLLVALATQIILTALQAACTLIGGTWVICERRLADMDRLTRIVTFMWAAEMLVTGVLFAACRVGELTYRRSEFYLSLYAAGVLGGFYLALLLWRQSSNTRPDHMRPLVPSSPLGDADAVKERFDF